MKRTLHTDTAPGRKRTGRFAFPNLLDMVVLLALFAASSLLAALCVSRLGWPMTPSDTPAWSRTLFVLYVIQMGTMILATLGYRRLRGGTHRVASLSWRGLDPLPLLWGVAVVLAVGIVLEPLLDALECDLFPLPEIGHGGWALLSAVAAAPLLEELLCRGLLLESLRARYGVVTAWAGSSLFFAVIHLQPAQAVNAFVTGLLLGFLCLATRSLWMPVLLHAFNNALALLLMRAELPGERFRGKVLSEMSFRQIVGDTWLWLVIYTAAAVFLLLSAAAVWRKLHLMRLDEQKKCTSEVINPAPDALNFDKKV